MTEDKGNLKEEGEIERRRRAQKNKLSQLNDFRSSYDSDKFMADLIKYFEGEEGLNLEKIREAIEVPGKLDKLILKAKEKNTYPVIEFVQELFKDLYSQD